MPITSSLCLSIAGCANSLTLLARHSAKLSFLLTFITFLIFSQLIYDGEHLDLTHFAYAHYYLLSVYTYCRMCKQLHTFGKTFCKAKLSVDIHQLMMSPVTTTLLAYLTYFHSSSHFLTYITYFAYAHYYLSVYLLQDARTVSYS